MIKYNFHRGWYFQSSETIANVVLLDFDLNFQSRTFEVAILRSKRWKKQTLLLPSDRKSDICHRMATLQMLYVMTMTYIFKVMNCQMRKSRKR